MTLEILSSLAYFYFAGALANGLREPNLSKRRYIVYSAGMVLLLVVGYLICLATFHQKPNYAAKVILAEDAIAETITVGLYLWAAANLIWIKGKKLFDYAMLVVCIFIAGEEISWGQRILGFETSEYWKELNPQDETTFRNLVLGGLVVWGLMLIPGVLYLFFGGFLFNKFPKLARLAFAIGIPQPKPNYAIVLVTTLLLNLTVEIPDNNELMETALSTLAAWFVIIELCPYSRPRYLSPKA